MSQTYAHTLHASTLRPRKLYKYFCLFVLFNFFLLSLPFFSFVVQDMLLCVMLLLYVICVCFIFLFVISGCFPSFFFFLTLSDFLFLSWVVYRIPTNGKIEITERRRETQHAWLMFFRGQNTRSVTVVVVVTFLMFYLFFVAVDIHRSATTFHTGSPFSETAEKCSVSACRLERQRAIVIKLYALVNAMKKQSHCHCRILYVLAFGHSRVLSPTYEFIYTAVVE